VLGFHLSPLALCCRFQRACSVFTRMNVAAVFAPEKVLECCGGGAFNCVPIHQFTATTWTTSDFCRVHAVLLRSPQIKNRAAPEVVPEEPKFSGFSQVNDCYKSGGTQRPSTVLRKRRSYT
jgi:hypothetical protein